MFKVGIILGSLGTGSVRDDLRRAKELGAHGVQLWVVDNEFDPSRFSPSGCEELVTYMASLGLERSALCGDIGGFVDPATVDERIARTRGMLELCVRLRTPILTTHIGLVPEDPASQPYSELLGAVREVAGYAAERGCCLATETGPESGAALARFLRAVDSPGAKANFDPANLCMNGFDYLQDLRGVAPYVVHTHAKDGIAHSAREGAFKEVPLGEGDVDFAAYLAVLIEIGYRGYLTIERECGEDPANDIARAVRFLKQFDCVEQ